MASCTVSSGSRSVEVEAANWLGALGVALPQLGLSSGALGRLVCTIAPDGTADATDPITNTRLRVAPMKTAVAPPTFAMPMSSLAGLYAAVPPAPGLEVEIDDADVAEELDEDEVTPPMARPAPQKAKPLEDRMFIVFDRCGDIAAASNVQGACSTALTILSDLVPADAGAVLVKSRGGESLRFAAAFGPRANRVVDTNIPVDQGIAGFSHNFGMGLVVEDVRRDARHYARVDRSSGYRTQSVLAVPLKVDAQSWGCMELLNHPEAFGGDDLEVAQVVAGSLAAWLQQAMG